MRKLKQHRGAEWAKRAICLIGSVMLVLWGGAVYGAASENDSLLRECVVTLQPVYDDAQSEYIQSLRNALGRRGYRTSADLLEDYTRGGFLSGVIVSWGGKKYVLTSRHGLSLAQRVVIERMGGEERIDGGEIVYMRGTTDLAVVALPADYAGRGLLLDSTVSVDDADLLVAGYAGLGEEPSWVLEGEHRALRSKSTAGRGQYIEYDASLDPGMTGSALLAEKEGEGLVVVGINIWNATLYERRSTAVPAGVAIRALRQMERGVEWGEAEANRLAMGINAGGSQLGNYLSDAYVMGVPLERVFAEFDGMERSVRKTVSLLFKAGEAVEGVRMILAYALQRGYSDADLRIESDGATRTLVSRGVRFPLGVERENGGWRINELEVPPRQSQKQYGLARSVGMRGTVRAGVKIPFYAQEGTGFTLSFSYTQWTYFFFQLGGEYGRYGYEVTNQMTDDVVRVGGTYLGLSPSLGVQLPVIVGEVLLLPYARGFYGMHYSLQSRRDTYQFFTNYRAVPGLGVGLDVAYRLSRGVYLVGGVEGQYVNISSNFGGMRVQGAVLAVTLGLGF